MWTIIPIAELLAALISSIGAFVALRMTERGFFRSLFKRWTDNNTVIFEGGKVEFLDRQKAPDDIKLQLASYLNYEEEVRKALESATSKPIKTAYDKDRCDFYLSIGGSTIGVEAKNSFSHVTKRYLETLLSSNVSRLLLVSEEPFDKRFISMIEDGDISDRVTLISAKDSDTLETALKEAVEEK